MSDQKSTLELSLLLGISVQHINRLSDAGKIPKKARNCFDLAESIKAFVSYREEEIRREYELKPKTSYDAEEEKARKLHFDADASQVKAELLMGQSHDAEAITYFMGRAIASTRARILSIPNATAAAVAETSDAEACRNILDAACREAAQELSDYDPVAVAGKTRRNLTQEEQETPADERKE